MTTVSPSNSDGSIDIAQAEPPLAWHKPARRRLEELDGLRGILALQVVFYHLQASFVGPSAWLNTFALPTVSGWFSVDVFFVMSGFVMMYVYGETFSREVRGAAFGRFFVARVARLYPVHLFALALFALAVIPYMWSRPALFREGGVYSIQSAVASLFMMHSPWIDHRSWNYPAWSISAEWHAYLVFPFAALLVARLRPHGQALLAACGVLVPLATYLLVLGHETYPTNGWAVLLRVLPLFMVGMTLHELDARYGRHFRAAWLALVTITVQIALLSSKTLAPLAVLLVPVLVLCTLNSPALQGLLRSRGALFLGTISYSLYMTHALIAVFALGLWTGKIAGKLGIDAAANDPLAWCLMALSVVGALVLGWLTFRFVEVPGRNLVLRWFGERKRTVPAVQPG